MQEQILQTSVQPGKFARGLFFRHTRLWDTLLFVREKYYKRTKVLWPRAVFLPEEAWEMLGLILFGHTKITPTEYAELLRIKSVLSWYPTQDRIVFSETMYTNLLRSGLDRTSMYAVFCYIPAPGIFIETRNLYSNGILYKGFFATLLWHSQKSRAELLLLLVSERGSTLSLRIQLAHGKIEDTPLNTTFESPQKSLSKQTVLDLLALLHFVAIVGFTDSYRLPEHIAQPCNINKQPVPAHAETLHYFDEKRSYGGLCTVNIPDIPDTSEFLDY